MANRRRDRELELQWRRVLRRHRASKLSVREFCRREALSEASFYAWRRTIAERDRQRKTTAEESAATPRRSSRPPAFVPVVVDAGELNGNAAEIVIELRGSRRLRLPETIEPARLATLIHAIEAEGRA